MSSEVPPPPSGPLYKIYFYDNEIVNSVETPYESDGLTPAEGVLLDSRGQPLVLELFGSELVNDIPLDKFPTDLQDQLAKDPARLKNIGKMYKPFGIILDSLGVMGLLPNDKELLTGSGEYTLMAPLSIIFAETHGVNPDLYAPYLEFVRTFIERNRKYPAPWPINGSDSSFDRNMEHQELLQKDWATVPADLRIALLETHEHAAYDRLAQMMFMAEAEVFLNKLTPEEFGKLLNKRKELTDAELEALKDELASGEKK